MFSNLARNFIPFWSRSKQSAEVFHELQEAQEQEQPEEGIYFGGLYLPESSATSHFMIVGTTGSGKTLTLRMMMRSVLPRLTTHEDQRAVIFDVKQDAVSTLYSVGLTDEQIIILNPFDKRCWEWDMAKDVQGPDTSYQIASIIVPEEQSQNRYFTDAARDLLAGVMNVLIEKGKERKEQTGQEPEWGLSDVIYATRNPERLKSLLAQTEAGEDLIQLHLQGDSTPKSVLSTLRTKLTPFEVIAALWSHARDAEGKPRRISLHDFLTQNKVLVLGNNQAARAPIEAINRVIFQRLTELVLDQTESKKRRNWFFLDETRKLGKLDGLDDLMTNGRSKGACVVIGFQDIDGLRAVYGKEVTGELTSMPANIGILKIQGESTPQWASAILGEQEVRETTYSSSETSGEKPTSTTGQGEQIREVKLYLPSEFRIIPPPSLENGLNGYFCSAFLFSRPYYASLRWTQVERQARLRYRGNSDDNFQPWEDPEFKKLRQWDVGDQDRLNVEIKIKSKDEKPKNFLNEVERQESDYAETVNFT